MKVGTKSVLFGVHCFLIHPLFVVAAWWKLFGFPVDPRLWTAFFLHDLGYFGKPNMDGPEGERHVEWAAKVMTFLFDRWTYKGEVWIDLNGTNGEKEYLIGPWGQFCLFHSRFYAKKWSAKFSRLCLADKLSASLTPAWLYLLLANLSGEISEYMEGKGARTPARGRSQKQWFMDVRLYLVEWVKAHKDMKPDTWTGTKRDWTLDTGK